ncbi:MAG: hypothetical protein JNK72_12185 [Myxococcales bacterium]|nr:hypothetical protein [Myxococcales bacterium]
MKTRLRSGGHAPPSFVLGVAALALAPALRADPLPVHTPTRAQPRGLSTDERLAVAEAVAEVLRGATTEVLGAADTRSRVETLNPDALACDAPTCCPTISTPLHARSVVLVQQQELRHRRLHLTVRVVNLRGEVTASNEIEEPVADRAEAVALARLAARPIADALRSTPATPAVTPTPDQPPPLAPPPTPAVAPTVQPPITVMPTVQYRVETYRRRSLAVLGAGLAAAGVTGITLGAMSLARDGGVARALPAEGVNEVYVSRTRDYIFVGAGAAATAAGVYFLVDGLRQRQRTVRISNFNVTGSSVSLTVEGRF